MTGSFTDDCPYGILSALTPGPCAQCGLLVRSAGAGRAGGRGLGLPTKQSVQDVYCSARPGARHTTVRRKPSRWAKQRASYFLNFVHRKNI